MAGKTASKTENKAAETTKDTTAAQGTAEAPREQIASSNAPRVRWNGAKMNTSYANFCNVTGTREEFTLLFGTNETWESDQFKVKLSERVVLSPYVAKRFATLLKNVVGEYEKRFGDLKID